MQPSYYSKIFLNFFGLCSPALKQKKKGNTDVAIVVYDLSPGEDRTLEKAKTHFERIKKDEGLKFNSKFS